MTQVVRPRFRAIPRQVEEQPASHYVWTPGAPPAKPPRAAWPRAAGVLVAIAAQVALYLALRHLAIATMPAWAHHRALHHGLLPWPAIVTADVLHGPATLDTTDLPALPAPVLSPVRPVELPPPELGPVR